MNTVTKIGTQTVEWTDEYGDEHDAYVEMVLAIPEEYPADVVAAVVEAQGRLP